MKEQNNSSNDTNQTHRRHHHDYDCTEHGEFPGRRHEHHMHPHGKRNFWSEWRDEHHHHGGGEHILVGQPLAPKDMEAWREFFQQTFGTLPEDHWIFGGRRFSPWHQGIVDFNPFITTLLSKGGGLLPLYVLHLIAQQPRYGNEIMDLLAEQTNGSWVSNPGAIYPLLAQLEKEGFITGEWEDPDKRTIRIYTITPSGKEEVSRIAMIVLPKLTETQNLLQTMVNNLQTTFTADDAGSQVTDDDGDLPQAENTDEASL